jgi:asparagine synthase (glutamine-hydrolysing)
MCGFAGIINLAGLQGDPAVRRSTLSAMGAQLARRGPDDEQIYDDGLLSLVFRRLSIIDIAGGQQPIWNEDHSILSVVNGEIFNHQQIRERLKHRHEFRSRSDSEVVVHLFEEGDDVLLEGLNGMYALLVWDTRNRRLLLARDRLGIKPLFYAETPEGLLFGSELKALLAHPACPRELNWQHFDTSRGFNGYLNTYIGGVEQLPGGGALSLQPGGSKAMRHYWSLSDHLASPHAAPTEPESWIQRYGELLHDSVTGQLMSDVPLGLFLSGGIDSSLLAAIAAGAKQDLHCFTVVEQTTLAAGDVEQSLELARRLGFRHHPVHYDSSSLLQRLQFRLADFEFMVWAVERPNFKVEWFMKLELHRYARTAVPGLKVIMLGQGADEFAGGYSNSMGNQSSDWQHYQQKLDRNHRAFRRIDQHIPEYLRTILSEHYPSAVQDGLDNSFQREMLYRTGVLTLYNLWHEDRTSSCQGIEARVPFLDHRLVELLASVPTGLHSELFYNKRIIREQLARVAPWYPPEKLKVKFHSTGQDDSIRRLKLEVVRRVYPQFREKYLNAGSPLFACDKLDEHYQFLLQQPAARNRDFNDLLECMATAVFAAQCRDMANLPPPAPSDRDSPLELWNPAAQPQSTALTGNWTMELRL